jgi:hypothetical protein
VPIFRGKNLFDGTSIEELKHWFESMDDLVEVEVDGLTAYGLGVVLGTDDYEIFSGEPPRIVIAFTRGYYDNNYYDFWAEKSGLNTLLSSLQDGTPPPFT